MKKLPIEQLLRWAICDELPKGRPVSMNVWDALVSYSRLGTRIQTSGTDDGLGVVPGTPHPDATIVAKAMEALPADARLPEEDCAALLGHYAALDLAAAPTFAALARFNLRAAVVRAAILKPPLWDVGSPLPLPAVRWNTNGHAVVHARHNGEFVPVRGDHKHGFGRFIEPQCFICWGSPSIAALLAARADYAVWHRGLEMMAAALTGRMAEHVALPPEAPPRPWATGAPPPSRLLMGLFAQKLRRLPLKPVRDPAPPPHRSAIERRARASRGRKNRVLSAATGV